MNSATRALLGGALLALLVSAGLHAAVLTGHGALWPALVHCGIYGWATAAIAGVVYHVLPVFARRRFPRPGFGLVVALLLTAGWAVTTTGLGVDSAALRLAGLTLELAGALAFTGHLVAAVTRGEVTGAPPPSALTAGQEGVDRVAAKATRVGPPCLVGSLALLLLAEAGVLDGVWSLAGRHLATLGWLGLIIVGVAWHVLPRFSGRATRGAGPARLALVLHGAGVALIVPALGSGSDLALAAGAVVMTAALTTFAWTVLPALTRTPPPSSFVPLAKVTP